MSSTLGGRRRPRVPDAATEPAAKRRSYPAASIAGSAIRPKSVTVGPTTPVAVENIVSVTIVATASDLRSGPVRSRMLRKRSLRIPARSMT